MSPAQVQAQSVNVSNITQTDDGSVDGNFRPANAFTTGGTTTDRYTLNSVILVLDVESTDKQFAVSIHNASSSNPDTQIGSNLTPPASLVDGNNTFTASGITLNGGTTYFVQFYSDGSGTGTTLAAAKRTLSDDEDSGSTSGWSIADEGRYYDTTTSSWESLGGTSLRFTINATTTVETLTPSQSTARGARLRIGNHTGAWWYKRTAPTPAGSCQSVSAGTSFVNLTGLSAGTSYTYKAYSASGWGDANELASTTFTTGYNLRVRSSSGAARVSWDAVSGASGYEVQYRASYPGRDGQGNVPAVENNLRVVISRPRPPARIDLIQLLSTCIQVSPTK